jgi:hypothetical protein
VNVIGREVKISLPGKALVDEIAPLCYHQGGETVPVEVVSVRAEAQMKRQHDHA